LSLGNAGIDARLLRIRSRVVPAVLLPAFFLSASPVAARVTVEAPPGDAMLPRLEQWVHDDAMPVGTGVIRIRPENCMAMEAEACTYWSEAPVFVMYFPDLEYLWTEPNHTEAERGSTSLNFYHELGHVLDFGRLRHAYRVKWFKIVHYQPPSSGREVRELVYGRNPGLWLSALDAEGTEVVPDEQFAQAYDYCAESMSYGQMRTTMEGTYWGFSFDPSRRQYREACELIGTL
jgi:hypothetical protein